MSSIVDNVKKAGVIGAGGAGFPTHVKINAKAEYVIGNGAECEPLLRVDQQLMALHADKVIAGLKYVMEATGAKYGVIALKDHYHDAIDALKGQIKGEKHIRLHIMRSYYPAGDEQQIVYEVTGKVVPTGGLPLDVGAVISNVNTLLNIAEAQKGNPVTEKYVTVGGAVKTPITLKVPVGISARELVAAAGGVTEEDVVYILGGPCMGRVAADIDIPVTKTTGGILAIPADHPLLAKKSGEMNLQLIKSVCCQCSMCTQMCPRNSLGLHVEPHKAMRSVAQGVGLIEDVNGDFSCCDCGICTYYACNFGLKPSAVMSQLKKELTSAGVKAKKEVYGPVDSALGTKRLPVSRMIARLGVGKYDVAAPLREDVFITKEVKIPLKMHIGAPSVPTVKEGLRVKKGDLIADIPEKALGAGVHASIDGTVAEVTDRFIRISA
ncbi:MAG: SLBB domain-containing protein [Clostridiales Family XIII bacterium]|jgi:Na+-translocating ferredoxin:NAD+ oxidoreductase RnfC subunit|nr:SLBB domain-containing protein [Clostridiales Family XIII bacterium]